MKKLLFVLTSVLLLTGCTNSIELEPIDSNIRSTTAVIKRIESSGTLSDGTNYEVNQDYYTEYSSRGIFDIGKNTYVIAMGEHSTGGYEIFITDIKIVDGIVFVYIGEDYPDGHNAYTDALTQPIVTVKFDKSVENIKFMDSNTKKEFK